MKLHQLSLFLENRPGQIKVPCQILGKAGINILTLSLADTQQFGILRLIVKDWQKARQALEDSGCVVNVTEVVPVEINDRPGGLAEVLDILDLEKQAIEYMYAFTSGKRGQKAVLVFRFENPDSAIQSLEKHGVRILDGDELFARVGD